MNFKNKALAILLILIFFISVLPAVSAVDYSIPYANVDIQVYDDGLINEEEFQRIKEKLYKIVGI